MTSTLDPPGSQRLCKKCKLLKSSDTFRVSNRYMAHCLRCRKEIGREHGGKNTPGTLAYYSKPRALRGPARLKRDGKYYPGKPLFSSLPEHLRPLAHERLKWMLAKHPDAMNHCQGSRRKPKYAAIVANVTLMVMQWWKDPDYAKKWSGQARAYKAYKKVIRRRLEGRPPVKLTSEQIKEIKEGRAEFAREYQEEQEREGFKPSKEAMDLAQSVKYVPPPKEPIRNRKPDKKELGSGSIWEHSGA